VDSSTKSKPGSLFLRREFLLGGLSGVTAAAGSALAAPVEWQLKTMPGGTKLSYSQNGEDLVAVSLLKAFGVEKPSYLDVGAYLPILGNNTYLMSRNGGRGVLVEPNVACIKELISKRPGDTVLNIGIGFSDTEEFADYYVLNHPQMNTFDGDEARRRESDSQRQTFVKEVVKMPLVPINKVIAEHLHGNAPDYFSVDVEGLELTILKTLDFSKYRPKVICADTLTDGGMKMNNGSADFLASKGYVIRGMTHPNTIFVDSKLL
jgi:FkbM family methyltransferase